MFNRCLFCHKPFPENEEFSRVPTGRRVAYDPGRGRLWAVCDHCNRWTLVPLESRLEALYDLERLARDVGRPVAHTAEITLLQTRTMLLIRIGRAGLEEQAWWRYGRQLQRRKRAFENPLSRATTWTYGALGYVGRAVGLADFDVKLVWDDHPMTDILRWRRFGWAAWTGRRRCPYCNSVLTALRYDVSWFTYPLWRDDGSVALGVPCPRCDPWTPEKIYTLEGDIAENVLRRVLAYQHITGGTERTIREAAQAIDEAGSVGAFTREVGSDRKTLFRMGSTRTLALEIALNESVEQRLMSLEAHALEFLWRREEELARIIDEELSPRNLWERLTRRLPPRLRDPIVEDSGDALVERLAKMAPGGDGSSGEGSGRE